MVGGDLHKLVDWHDVGALSSSDHGSLATARMQKYNIMIP